jgi:hypothetical protein
MDSTPPVDAASTPELAYTSCLVWDDAKVRDARAKLRYCALLALQALVDATGPFSGDAFNESRMVRDTALLAAATKAFAQADRM